MQLSLFSNLETTELKEGFSLEAIFEAYFSCRSNKRNTINALAFELDYESNLIQLSCPEIGLHIKCKKKWKKVNLF